MGRLIDADEMLKRLEEWNTNDGIDKALYKFCVERINEQPTAYDVEKVVAEVKEENKRALQEMYKFHGNNYETVLTKKHNDRIDCIVRKGGVDHEN